MSRQQQHPRSGPVQRECVEAIDELQAREPGHADIAQYETDLASRGDVRQGGFGMGLRPAGIARAGENTLEEDEHRGVVIQEQHFVSDVH